MNQITWTSHRGLWRGTDENTRFSFQKAVDAGFDQLETDLRVTKDDHIVLCHDSDISRVSGIKNQHIQNTTRAELESLRLLHGEKFLFFDEFVDQFSKLTWILDIKEETGHQVVKLLPNYLDKEQVDRTEFLFWNQSQEDSFVTQHPSALILAKEKECIKAGISSIIGCSIFRWPSRYTVYAVPPQHFGIQLYKPRIARMYQKHQAEMICYLPETQKQVEQAYHLQIKRFLLNDNFIIRN